DVVLPVGGEDRLEPQLGDALLPPCLPHVRIGAGAAEERARAGRVPRAALVVADPARAGREERLTQRIQRFARDEDDELPVHRFPSLPGGKARLMATIHVQPRPTPEERHDGQAEIEVDEGLTVFASTIEEWTAPRQEWEFTLHEGTDFGRANNVEG